MKNIEILVVALAMAGLACGGLAPESLELEPVEGQPLEGSVYPQAAREELPLVDSLEVGDGVIDFLSVESDEGTFVLVTQLYDGREGDLYSRLMGGSPEPVSAAELWRHVTGRSDVPDALRRDHERLAAQIGRSIGYQQTFEAELRSPREDVSVEKAVSDTLTRAMFPILFAGTCWKFPETRTATVTEPTQPELTACASDFGQLGKAARWYLPGACASSQNETGFWRAVVYSEPIGVATSPKPSVQSCVWQSNTTVSCSPFRTLLDHQSFAGDASGTLPHRHDVGLAPTVATAGRTNVYHFGSGQLVQGVVSSNNICVPGL